MKKEFYTLLFITTLMCLFILSGCDKDKAIPVGADEDTESSKVRMSSINLPITEREFYIGVLPTPKNDPVATPEDLFNGYKEAAKIGEVIMIWPENPSIGVYDLLKENRIVDGFREMGLIPIINMNFATIKIHDQKGLALVVDSPGSLKATLDDHDFRQSYINEAERIAAEFKPKFFSLGNDVGSWYEINQDTFNEFVTLYHKAYDAIKKVSPDTKVFITFSLNQMVENDHWEIIKMFEPRLDMVGITTYPWKKHDNPEDIPPDYFTKILEYTDRPVAFTEIGWISAESKGSDEMEQARFVSRFLEITEPLDIVMINWLFLHETTVSGLTQLISAPETSTIALKNADGTEKEIYKLWTDLKNVPYSR